MGCYIWYSEKGPGWAAVPPSPLLALPVYQLHIIKYHVACELCYPLLYIFNLSFEKGLVPDKLKLAKVVPVFKCGNDNNNNIYLPEGYKPIRAG